MTGSSSTSQLIGHHAELTSSSGHGTQAEGHDTRTEADGINEGKLDDLR